MIKNKTLKKMADYAFCKLNIKDKNLNQETFYTIKLQIKTFYVEISQNKIINLIAGLVIKKINTFYKTSEKKLVKRNLFISNLNKKK